MTSAGAVGVTSILNELPVGREKVSSEFTNLSWLRVTPENEWRSSVAD